MKKYTIVLLLVTAFICGCKKKEEKKQISIPPTPAQFVTAEPANVSSYISTMGTIASEHSVNVVPQVSGQIVSINFKQGQNVKKGDILAVIDKRPYIATVKQAEGSLRQAQAQLKIDELSVARNKKLAKDGYVDKQTFDSLVAKVEVDKGVVESAKASLETAKINLDWCDIKSPVDGKVGLYNINSGNFVSAGSSVITTIENIDNLFVDFVIPSQRLHDVMNLMKLNNGKVFVEVSYIEDDMASRCLKAEVDIVLNKIRYESGTAVLRGKMKNQNHLFWPNQPVRVKLDLDKLENAVLIPDMCIQLNAVGPYVYVATEEKNGVYVVGMKQVKKGQLYGQNRAVFGIKAGDKVVLRISQLRLQAGPFVYASTAIGEIIDANGKIITDKKQMFSFMAEATKIADAMRADFMKKQMQATQNARDIKAEVQAATKAVEMSQQQASKKVK